MKATKLPSDSGLIRPRAGKEKDPGSAFGPESDPLATGLVPVVYRMPGPFPGPTPRSSRICAASPDLISLPVWLASPVLD